MLDNRTELLKSLGGLIDINTVTTYYDFYRFSNPDEPIKTEVRSEVVTQRDGRTQRILRRDDTNSYYDSLGNLTFRYTQVYARVPDPFLIFTMAFRLVSTEIENFLYAVHPYDIKSIYRYRYTKAKVGYY
jgi:hypothetical protein